MSWNLAHQTREVAIHPALSDVICGLGVDVAMFNEFVDGPSRDSLKAHLHRLGLEHVLVSAAVGNSNQVLIASRHPLEPGDLRSPMPDTVAPANWYHVRVPSHGVELIQLRMPWWNRKATRDAYQSELATLLAPCGGRPLVVCGDFNHDPFHRQPSDANEVRWLGLDSFVVPRPVGEWSFVNKQGTGRSRIDHVAHTRLVTVTDVRYQPAFGDVTLAGGHVSRYAPPAERPVSDHAPLLFTVRAARA